MLTTRDLPPTELSRRRSRVRVPSLPYSQPRGAWLLAARRMVGGYWSCANRVPNPQEVSAMTEEAEPN
jgi:hypothetical protein